MSKSLQEAMKAEFGTLPDQPRAHIHTTASVSGTIATLNTWQKLDLSTGSPSIQMQGGFTWNTTSKRIIWDTASSLAHALECVFIGDAQLQITSAIVGTEILELGLVLNGGITPPVVVTPISFTNQTKLNGFGANHNFSNYTNPTPADNRLTAGDYLELFIRSTTNTPAFQINGMNVTFLGR